MKLFILATLIFSSVSVLAMDEKSNPTCIKGSEEVLLKADVLKGQKGEGTSQTVKK